MLNVSRRDLVLGATGALAALESTDLSHLSVRLARKSQSPHPSASTGSATLRSSL